MADEKELKCLYIGSRVGTYLERLKQNASKVEDRPGQSDREWTQIEEIATLLLLNITGSNYCGFDAREATKTYDGKSVAEHVELLKKAVRARNPVDIRTQVSNIEQGFRQQIEPSSEYLP